MKIIDNVFRDYKFEELVEGATFKFGDEYFLKIEEFHSSEMVCNAINLVSGALDYIMRHETVHPFNCELIIL